MLIKNSLKVHTQKTREIEKDAVSSEVAFAMSVLKFNLGAHFFSGNEKEVA